MNATPDWLCGAVEIALNRYLRLEPAVLADCAGLEGRVLALHADALDWTLFLQPHAQGVQVLGQGEGRPGGGRAPCPA